MIELKSNDAVIINSKREESIFLQYLENNTSITWAQGQLPTQYNLVRSCPYILHFYNDSHLINRIDKMVFRAIDVTNLTSNIRDIQEIILVHMKQSTTFKLNTIIV